jgi:plasmid stability protein
MRIMERKKLLYLDDELDAGLRRLAQRRHESVSATIRMGLRIGLAVLEGKPLPLAEITAPADNRPVEIEA